MRPFVSKVSLIRATAVALAVAVTTLSVPLRPRGLIMRRLGARAKFKLTAKVENGAEPDLLENVAADDPVNDMPLGKRGRRLLGWGEALSPCTPEWARYLVLAPEQENVGSDRATTRRDIRSMRKTRTMVMLLVALAATLALASPAPAAPGKLVVAGCQSSAQGPSIQGCSQLQGLSYTGAVAFSADGYFAYASFPDGISVFARDRATGVLSFAQCLSAGGNSPGGDSQCAEIPGIVGTAVDIVATPDGRSVYSSGGRRETLLGFARDPLDGALAFMSCEYSSYGASGDLPGCPVGAFQEARQVESTRDGRAIYLADRACADNTGDCFASVIGYRRNPESSALGLRDRSDPATDGAGPFAVAGAGTVYEVDSEHGTISVFGRVGAAGFRRVQCLWPRPDPYGPRCATVPPMRRAQAIALSPNGRGAVTAVGLGKGAGGVVVFDRARDGKLRFRGCLGPGGVARAQACRSLRTPPGLRLADPRQLEFSRDGRSLYLVAGEDRARFLVRFKVNPERGKIAFAQCFTAVRTWIERPGCRYLRKLRGLTKISLAGRFLYAITANRHQAPGLNALVRFRAKRR
jgi:hypothetical protein